MNDLATLITNASPTVVIAVIFWKIMLTAFQFHARSMAEQRKDMLSHMSTVCKSHRQND